MPRSAHVPMRANPHPQRHGKYTPKQKCNDPGNYGKLAKTEERGEA